MQQELPDELELAALQYRDNAAVYYIIKIAN